MTENPATLSKRQLLLPAKAMRARAANRID